jgi:hypothetical protein
MVNDYVEIARPIIQLYLKKTLQTCFTLKCWCLWMYAECICERFTEENIWM